MYKLENPAIKQIRRTIPSLTSSPSSGASVDVVDVVVVVGGVLPNNEVAFNADTGARSPVMAGKF